MKVTVLIALVGWLPISQIFYATMSVHRATLVTVIAGWLLLPMSGFRIPGIPDYDKVMAVSLAALLGILIYGGRTRHSWKFSIWDLAIVGWCVTPFITSHTNGLGTWDGVSTMTGNFAWYGMPYYIGRRMFGSERGILSLAVGLVVAGLLYSLPALWEIRMSPTLNYQVYGFVPMKFHAAWRLGGYRPVVFLNHGLELGLLMSVSALSAVWLWRPGQYPRILHMRLSVVAPYLLVVALLCRALNGMAALVLGLGALVTARVTRLRLPILILSLLPMGYVFTRTVLRWDVAELVSLTESIDSTRARSFASRIDGEELMIEKVRSRPLFGWGDWDRNRVMIGEGRHARYLTVDSMWIIETTKKGVVGMLTLIGLFSLPAILGAMTLGGRGFASRRHAGFAICSLAAVLFLIDGMVNYMLSPLYVVSAGAAMTYITNLRRVRRAGWPLPTASRSARVYPRGAPARQ